MPHFERLTIGRVFSQRDEAFDDPHSRIDIRLVTQQTPVDRADIVDGANAVRAHLFFHLDPPLIGGWQMKSRVHTRQERPYRRKRPWKCRSPLRWQKAASY